VKKLILLIILIYGIASHATEPRAYVVSQGFFSAATIIDGRNIHDEDLETAMKSNPEAVAYARQSRIDTQWSNGLFAAGTIGAISFALLSGGHGNSHLATFWTIEIAGIIPSLVLGFYAWKNRGLAFDVYNGIDIHKKWSMQPILTPVQAGGTLGVAWQF
jgi:hypothetical protein